ncbi:MAG: flippase-like domain-containing protein [Candidatus Omnitrophica bacterium]|nr:flippase-like domain-containing protein [Candidatus Omnitrophota bacterium]
MKNKKKLFNLAIILLCGIFILYFFNKHKQDFSIIKNLRWVNGLVITLYVLLLNLLTSVKFLIILKKMGLKDLSISKWFPIFILSRFANCFFSQGTNIYRSYRLKKDFDFPYAKALGVIIFVSWFDVLVMSSFLCVFFYFKPNIFNHSTIPIRQILQSIFLLCLILPFIFVITEKHSHKGASKNIWLYQRIHDFSSSILFFVKTPFIFLHLFILTLVIFLIYVFCVDFCLYSLNVSSTKEFSALLSFILLLTRTINIIPGNIGLGELICGATTNAFGYSLGVGIFISAIFRCINFVLLGLLSLCFSSGFRDLKAIFRKNKEI